MKKRFALLALLLPVVCIAQTTPIWEVQVSNTTHHLNDIEFIGEQDGFAVGANGTIQHTTDGGTNWVSQSSGTTEEITAVSMVDAQTAFACGTNKTLLKTINGGAVWIPMATAVPDSVHISYSDISFLTANVGYAVGNGWDSAYLVKTVDGGAHWTIEHNENGWSTNNGGYEAEGFNYQCLYFQDELTGFVGGEHHIYPFDYASTYLAHILITHNGGGLVTNGYHDMYVGATDQDFSWGNYEVLGYDFPNPDTGFAIATKDMQNLDVREFLMRTDQNGFSNFFEEQNFWPGIGLTDLDFISTQTGYFSSDSGAYVTYDAETISNLNAPGSPQLTSVMFPMDSVGYFSGENGTILKYHAPDILGLDDHKKDNLQVSVFPNPANVEVRLRINNGVHQDGFQVVLRNHLGQVVLQETVQAGQTHTINTGILPAGHYVYQISGAGIAHGQLVIVH